MNTTTAIRNEPLAPVTEVKQAAIVIPMPALRHKQEEPKKILMPEQPVGCFKGRDQDCL
ncbi:hypothetical protein [Paraflavitalea pollutisoli]|uniref:hypothetical protein n=1 Tax=Paraflavitalea pollutisoli TaxID=3034143 RepID=UPI0023EC2747|nr:hypothetical protein [Paraflavitalea sp. H1-2-19X]